MIFCVNIKLMCIPIGRSLQRAHSDSSEGCFKVNAHIAAITQRLITHTYMHACVCVRVRERSE